MLVIYARLIWPLIRPLAYWLEAHLSVPVEPVGMPPKDK